ncbi:MAG: hypothetical protein U0289_06640 [Cyclobacteriaceae bacterium]|nr:hypothetical protein [Cyclobacteriaceae bacterium]
MKTQLTIAIVLISASALLLGFASRDNEQTKRTEEYGYLLINYSNYNHIVEKTINGKTETFELKGEKIETGSGKYFSKDIVNELNKMNEQGFEIVNVTASTTVSGPRELYLFKRKL